MQEDCEYGIRVRQTFEADKTTPAPLGHAFWPLLKGRSPILSRFANDTDVLTRHCLCREMVASDIAKALVPIY